MGEFTYTVFVVVASMVGTLVTVFAGGVAAALILAPDGHPRAGAEVATGERTGYQQAA